MIDLTLKKEDKDSYITNVRLNEDHTYTVTYASGREETSPFSIHNYQVELYRMENSFKEHGDEYVKRIWNNGPIRSYILGLLLVADGLYLEPLLSNYRPADYVYDMLNARPDKWENKESKHLHSITYDTPHKQLPQVPGSINKRTYVTPDYMIGGVT